MLHDLGVNPIHHHPPRFERQIVWPTVAALATVALLLVAGFYAYLNWQDHHDRQATLRRSLQVWNHLHRDTAAQLEWAAAQAAADPVLQNAMRQRDPQALLAQAQPVFAKLLKRFGIGHWYFIAPDQRVLLRVHSPADRGDLIRRKTFQEAVASSQGVSGVELGSMASLTLRHVLPWRVNGELLGYIEFGAELGWFAASIHDILGLEVLAAVHKPMSSAASFAVGQRVFGFPGQWEDHSQLALLNQTMASVPPTVFPAWEAFVQGQGPEVAEVRNQGSLWAVGFLPLQDHAGRTVASLALLKNRDAFVARRNQLVGGCLVLVVGLIALVSLVLVLRVRRIARAVQASQQAQQASEQRVLQLNSVLESQVAERTAALVQANEALRHLAQHDALTGLANRRVADERLHAEFGRLQRTGMPYAVLMADIDHFKQVNDTYGHTMGDQVLQQVAQALERTLRITDFVARFGGEEFLALLPDTTLAEACHVAEKLRAAVQAYTLAATPSCPVTVSIGVAQADRDQPNAEAAVREADAQLYAAKAAGRNCVMPATGQQA